MELWELGQIAKQEMALDDEIEKGFSLKPLKAMLRGKKAAPAPFQRTPANLRRMANSQSVSNPSSTAARPPGPGMFDGRPGSVGGVGPNSTYGATMREARWRERSVRPPGPDGKR